METLPESTKNPGGRPKIELSDIDKQKIQLYAGRGVPIWAIAEMLDMSERTLHRRFHEDPEVLAAYQIGVYRANFQVSQWLFDSCRPIYERVPKTDSDGNPVINNAGMVVYEDILKDRGNVSAQIFWMKTRAGWKETVQLEMSNPVYQVPPEIEALPDDKQDEIFELLSRVAELVTEEGTDEAN